MKEKSTGQTDEERKNFLGKHFVQFEKSLAMQITRLEKTVGVQELIKNRAIRVKIYGAKFVHSLYRDKRIKTDNIERRKLN